MAFSRRNLLKFMGAGLVLQSCIPVKKQGSLLTNPEVIYSGFRVGEAYVSQPAGLIISSPFSTEKITFANEIHSIVHSEKLKLKVFVSKLELLSYAQFGNGPYIEFKPEAGNYFYGHGLIDEKRNLFYSTQAQITKDRDDGGRNYVKGFVYVHALPGFEIIEKFPTFGNDPHDMKMLGDELLICNGGIDSSITVVDLKTKQLVKEYKVNEPHLSLRHIEPVNDQNFIIATLTSDLKKPTPLYGLNLKNGLHVYKTPAEIQSKMMRSQLLSVCHYKGHVFASCPATHMVLVWNVSGEFIGGQRILAAAGLAVSKELDAVIVCSGSPGERARVLNVDNGMIKIRKLEWAMGITGSHATVV